MVKFLCATCGGKCHWAEDAWVCLKCGNEWAPDEREALLDAIVDILERGNNVPDWPDDEAELHRRSGWPSFKVRHLAVQRLRAEKIISLLSENEADGL